jgi:integrase/recombinase XerD
MDMRPLAGPALVTTAADADPVTLLVLGWLATKRSANTRSAYARDLGIAPARRASRAKSWLAWCQWQGVHPVTGVTGWHVMRYAMQLENAGLSAATTNRKLAAISSWYDWLIRRGHVGASPVIGLPRPKSGVGQTEAGLGTRPMAATGQERADLGSQSAPCLTRQQALALVHAADTAPGAQRARTAAMIAVLVCTGARVGEVINADFGDLGTDQGHRVLLVTRAGARREGLILPEAAASRIDAYLTERADLADGSALFASRTGRRLFAADVGRAVRRVARRAGLPSDLISRLGPRLIRRSFVALYLEAGGSLRGLQGALGHADPRTTLRYDRTVPAPASRSARARRRHSPAAGARPHCRAHGPRRPTTC